MYLYMQPLLNDVVNGFNGSRIGVDEITSCQFIHEVCACVRVCVCVCVCVWLSFFPYLHQAYLDLLQTLCGDA